MSRQPTSHALLHALPAPPIATIFTPVALYLPQLYAKETSVALAMLGAVLLVARIFDGVTDQLIRYLSDITQTRLGSRKPWMMGGTVVVLMGGYFLLNPP